MFGLHVIRTSSRSRSTFSSLYLSFVFECSSLSCASNSVLIPFVGYYNQQRSIDNPFETSRFRKREKGATFFFFGRLEKKRVVKKRSAAAQRCGVAAVVLGVAVRHLVAPLRRWGGPERRPCKRRSEKGLIN